MAKRMLIDATRPEETRVAVVNGSRLEEFDYETEFRKQLKGNIYLAKVTRVEPSLQAAFVEYGGNRHAFLPFPEIHQDYYRIPMSDRSHLDEHEGESEHSHGDHEHDGETSEPSPETALSGEGPVQLRSDYEDDLISEAFDHVNSQEPADRDNQPDSLEAQHQDHDGEDDSNEESAAENGQADAPSSDPFGPEVGTASDSRPTESQNEPGETTVETVGGDEVDEIRHRRRSMMPRYKIQEVIKRRQIMLIQVSKEERGNKGAAVTTFLSLPGRYCVLMPNTPRGGGISRKIANPQDRKRLKELLGDLDLPDGMSVILRTAGVERTKAEIKRDLDYLMRLWEAIRDLTLKSTAPAMVYEEGNLIKRSIRDIYGKDIDELIVAGEVGFRQAKDFMRMLMPSHAKRVQLYRDQVPLFFRHQVESQIDAVHNPVAQLRSGGYVVINQTEALVSIDVNSGRSTRERNIEETAYKTNLEAADEIARQLRLRDMGGLVVVDFIDMEDPRHDGAVERRLKEAMKNDRARIQIGRMSAFGLLELSRQRLHPSLLESSFHTCATCRGTGLVRSTESAGFMALRAIEEEAIKGRAAEIVFHAHTAVALYLLNHQRNVLGEIEQRYALRIIVAADDSLITPDFRIDRVRMHPPGFTPPVFQQPLPPVDIEDEQDEAAAEDEEGSSEAGESSDEGSDGEGGQERGRRRRRRRGRRKGQFGDSAESSNENNETPGAEGVAYADQPDAEFPPESIETSQPMSGAPGSGDETQSDRSRRRRRGRRGGRGRLGDATTPMERDEAGGETFGDAANDPFGPDPFGGSSSISSEVESTPSDNSAEPLEETVAEPAAHSTPARETRGIHTEQPDNPTLDRPQPAPSVAREFETVNQQPDTPRQGWWKRLIQ
jgi:ribonuclease E